MPPYKIVLTGVESTGKTTLSRQLSAYYSAPWLGEYARTYLTQLDRPYGYEDLLVIAQQHIIQEDALLAMAAPDTRFVFLDTDLVTLQLWSEVKYGTCDPWIKNMVATRPYDLYLLCAPDIAWEPDPLRENPHDREELHEVYVRTLTQLNKPYLLVQGDMYTRLDTVIRQLEALYGA